MDPERGDYEYDLMKENEIIEGGHIDTRAIILTRHDKGGIFKKPNDEGFYLCPKHSEAYFPDIKNALRVILTISRFPLKGGIEVQFIRTSLFVNLRPYNIYYPFEDDLSGFKEQILYIRITPTQKYGKSTN